MYRRYKERFGTAGVVLGVIALIVALGGSAIAASGLNGKQKKQVKAIAKSFQGTGPAGAAGTPGTNGTNGEKGAKGDNGTNGTDGDDGTNGQSVTTDEILPLTPECNEQGGVELHSASGDNVVCNGAKGSAGTPGSPWTAGGTLPVGSTETGAWSLFTNETGGTIVLGVIGFDGASLSFNVPLAAGLDAGHVHYVTGAAPTDCETAHAGTASAANPEAASGHLCVYQASSQQLSFESISNPVTAAAGAAVSGAVLEFEVGGNEAFARGTWAVTG